MKIKEIMEKYPATINLDTPVKEIAELMVEHRIPSLPVVDEDFKLLGIVSEADLLYKRVRPQAPHYVNLLGASIYYGGIGEYNENFHKLLAAEAKELMTKEVFSCSQDDEIEVVASLMLEKHLKVLPVVKDQRVVGTVSRRDIIELIAKDGY